MPKEACGFGFCTKCAELFGMVGPNTGGSFGMVGRNVGGLFGTDAKYTECDLAWWCQIQCPFGVALNSSTGGVCDLHVAK